MSTTKESQQIQLAEYLRNLVRQVVAEMNAEKEQERQRWSDCDCGL